MTSLNLPVEAVLPDGELIKITEVHLRPGAIATDYEPRAGAVA